MLSGGQSRRFGQDKAGLLHPDGRTLLARTCALAAALPARVVVVGPEAPPGLARCTDPAEGPLAALAVAHAAFPEVTEALWLPVDLPCLDLPALRALVAPLPPGLAWRGAGPPGAGAPPLPGWVGPAVIQRLGPAVAAGERSLRRALDGLPGLALDAAALGAAGAHPDALRDADTPAGWTALLGSPPRPATR